MNRKLMIVLLIISLALTGLIVLFPDNLIDQKIMISDLDKRSDLYTLFYYLTFLGSKIILVPFVIAGSIYLFVNFKTYQPSVIFISGTILGYVLNVLIKQLVKRERPSVVEEVYGIGFSFPSGHAMISTICYGLFVYYLLKLVKAKCQRYIVISLTTLMLLVIGYSRIVLEVHYFTDIVVGYLFGLLFIGIYLRLTQQVSQS